MGQVSNFFSNVWSKFHTAQEVVRHPVQVPGRCSSMPNYDMKLRTQVFEETLLACKEGYRFADGHEVQINSEAMQKGTFRFAELSVNQLPIPLETYNTEVSVVTQDTFTVMLSVLERFGKVVGMNMANLYYPGGGVRGGCSAQEEALCRSSDYIKGIDPEENSHTTHTYPLDRFGGIFSPGVSVFRASQAEHFEFMREPKKVDLAGVALYDLREGSHERRKLGLPFYGDLSIDMLRNNSQYMEGIEKIITSFFVAAAMQGHIDVVPGALGCGAFRNPPELVAEVFSKVLQKEGLKGRFRTVTFAILQLSPSDARNIEIFRGIVRSS